MGKQKRSENTYQKINAIYKRDQKGYIMPFDGFVTPELEWLRKLPFEATEKIDGTNMRFEIWPVLTLHDDESYSLTFKTSVKGKTDNANIRPQLMNKMNEIFNPEMVDKIIQKMYDIQSREEYFLDNDEDIEYLIENKIIEAVELEDGDYDFILGTKGKKVTFYGEGYGDGIRDKQHYCHGNDYIGFDIKVGDTYLLPEVRRQIFDELGIPCVPFLGYMNIDEAIAMVYNQFNTNIGDIPEVAEGIVLSSPCGVRFRNSGERIIVKVKSKDFVQYLRKYPENTQELKEMIGVNKNKH